MKNYLILTDNHGFKFDTSSFDRVAGDKMNIENKSWEIIFVNTDLETTREVWNELIRKINAKNRAARKEQKEEFNSFLRKQISKASKNLGIDLFDAAEVYTRLKDK